MHYTLNDHPLHRSIYDLCQEIEKLPPSDHATKLVVMAGALQQPVAQLRAVHADAADRLAELKRENAALRKQRDEWKSCAERTDAKMLHEQSDHNKTVERLVAAKAENAALREDKERLDWLDHNAISWKWMSPEKIDGLGPIVVSWKSNCTLRAALDAARKEAQP